jgi:hypothetical protein
VGLSSVVEHPKVLLAPTTQETKEEEGQQILDNKIIVTIGQLLKLALDLNMYLIAHLISSLLIVKMVPPKP